MATQSLDLVTTNENNGHLTFRQVLAMVSTADAQSLFRQAAAYEQVISQLEFVEKQLRHYHAGLESAWRSVVPDQFGVLHRLEKFMDELISLLSHPGDPALLRQLGDAILSAQQRLRAIAADAAKPVQPVQGDGTPEGDAAAAAATKAAAVAAAAARDELARRILAELSATYRQVGGQFPALPAEDAAGQPLRTVTVGRTGTPTPVTTGAGPAARGGATDPGTSAPGTTAPGTTAPGTTAPGTTAPGTTAPGTTTPGTESGSGPGTGAGTGQGTGSGTGQGSGAGSGTGTTTAPGQSPGAPGSGTETGTGAPPNSGAGTGTGGGGAGTGAGGDAGTGAPTTTIHQPSLSGGAGASQGAPAGGGMPLSSGAPSFTRQSTLAVQQPLPAQAPAVRSFSGFSQMALASNASRSTTNSAGPVAGGPRSSGTGSDLTKQEQASKQQTTSSTTDRKAAAAAEAERLKQELERQIAAGAKSVNLVGSPQVSPSAGAGVPAPRPVSELAGPNLTTPNLTGSTLTGSELTASEVAAARLAERLPVVSQLGLSASAGFGYAAFGSAGVSPGMSASVPSAPSTVSFAPPTLAARSAPLPGELLGIPPHTGGAAGAAGSIGAGASGVPMSGALPPPRSTAGAAGMTGTPARRPASTWLRAEPNTWSGGVVRKQSERKRRRKGQTGDEVVCEWGGVRGETRPEDGKEQR